MFKVTGSLISAKEPGLQDNASSIGGAPSLNTDKVQTAEIRDAFVPLHKQLARCLHREESVKLCCLDRRLRVNEELGQNNTAARSSYVANAVQPL